MTPLRPSRKLLRSLAGEGDFHAYRLLRSGRRGFLFAKCIAVTLSHGLRRGDAAERKTVVFLKGRNQPRYMSFVASQLEAEFGNSDIFTASPSRKGTGWRRLAGFSPFSVLRQAAFLTLMLATGRKRYLDLYLLAFQAEIDKLVRKSFEKVENFVCFNDQPYDVAAIVNALHKRENCLTVVIQHGLIINEKFYFPAVAREFWAWGELSKRHYRSWNGAGQIILKGRYADDTATKRERYLPIPAGRPLNILVAPSYVHDEVKEIVSNLKAALPEQQLKASAIAMKLHPATKFKGRLKLWFRKTAHWLKYETAPMEILADKYDALVTRNSTSAVDFLLRGKPVFFHPPPDGKDFPSMDYGFALSQLEPLMNRNRIDKDGKNHARRTFLKEALNV